MKYYVYAEEAIGIPIFKLTKAVRDTIGDISVSEAKAFVDAKLPLPLKENELLKLWNLGIPTREVEASEARKAIRKHLEEQVEWHKHKLNECYKSIERLHWEEVKAITKKKLEGKMRWLAR